MSFNATAKTIGTSNLTIFECPELLNGSVHGLVISNVSAASASLVLRFHDNSEGVTTTIRNVDIPAKGEFVFPKPINVSPGDRIIASASTSGALVALNSVYLSEVVPVAKSLVPRGNWFELATYDTLDVVSFEGRSYLAMAAIPAGTPPPGGGWMLLADKGDPSGVHRVHGVEPGEDNNVVLPEASPEASGVMSAEDKDKLDAIAAEATKNATDAHLLARANHTGTQGQDTIVNLVGDLASKAPLASPTFTGNVTGITKDMVGLGNVDNTTDENKPISAAVRDALETKESTLAPGIPNQFLAGDKSWKTIQADQIEGLEEAITFVDNLVSTDAGKALSANQGKVLKDLIDHINSLLQSDDSTLDELQEIVDFVKLNRADLNALGIDSIAGLGAALDGKQPLSSILSDTTASFTAALKTKLDAIAAGAQVNTVTSVSGRTGAITLAKADVGLSNVDNTSDLDKPISNAVQAILGDIQAALNDINGV